VGRKLVKAENVDAPEVAGGWLGMSSTHQGWGDSAKFREKMRYHLMIFVSVHNTVLQSEGLLNREALLIDTANLRRTDGQRR